MQRTDLPALVIITLSLATGLAPNLEPAWRFVQDRMASDRLSAIADVSPLEVCSTTTAVAIAGVGGGRLISRRQVAA